MCGIAGLVKSKHSPVEPNLLWRMIATLDHRGPDDSGVFVDSNVGLAHARLSIIDLAGGHQPMSIEDGALSITFNGEIFNYIELREELEKRGHRFTTRSDTEVILRMYLEKGEDCARYFNGQWDLERARRQRGPETVEPRGEAAQDRIPRRGAAEGGQVQVQPAHVPHFRHRPIDHRGAPGPGNADGQPRRVGVSAPAQLVPPPVPTPLEGAPEHAVGQPIDRILTPEMEPRQCRGHVHRARGHEARLHRRRPSVPEASRQRYATRRAGGPGSAVGDAPQ